MTVATLPNWFTVSEAARHAKVSSWSIRKEIERGNLTARRVGRCVRILDEELARWMTGATVSPAGPADAGSATGSPDRGGESQ